MFYNYRFRHRYRFKSIDLAPVSKKKKTLPNPTEDGPKKYTVSISSVCKNVLLMSDVNGQTALSW